MKIALPVANKKLCMHFGHCEEFLLAKVDMDKKEINQIDFVKAPPHQPGLLPKWLSDQGANYIIAGGMGARAQSLFNEMNIIVITGAQESDPEKVIKDYLNDTLKTGQNSCDH